MKCSCDPPPPNDDVVDTYIWPLQFSNLILKCVYCLMLFQVFICEPSRAFKIYKWRNSNIYVCGC